MVIWSTMFLLLLIPLVHALREFRIDYPNQQFIKDGQPFKYISGSVHYFRTHPSQWEDRIRMVRSAGLNAIQTYIPWNYHEMKKGVYDFAGPKNFTEFFEIAARNELYILLRPGPYVCAEWEYGGLPHWLIRYPNITLRSSQKDFLREALTWWDVLLPIIEPYLYHNGGPILMTQIENEYGSYGCDKVYLNALRDKALSVLGSQAVLYTTDGPSGIKCGKIENVFATVDFGSTEAVKGDEYFDIQQKSNNGGPRVNSEFYPGWFLMWGAKKPFEDTTPDEVLKMTEYFWSRNASFNFYMFHGGTNFGFWNGAEYDGPIITSYDYWAPMSENGANTTKFDLIRSFLVSQSSWPQKPLPVPSLPPTMSAKNIKLQKFGNIYDFMPVILDKSNCREGNVNFEELDQLFGFVRYSFKLAQGGRKLNGTNIKDFGFVFVNQQFKGRTSSHFKAGKVEIIDIDAKKGDSVDIFVENQGRLTYLTAIDHKGIIGDIYIDGNPISGIKSCPLNIDKLSESPVLQPTVSSKFTPGDVFVGQFTTAVLGDTNIDMSKWGKGIVWINQVNIGRYWSTQGPQMSLYIPSPLLKDVNEVVIVEFEKLSSTCLQKSTFCSIDVLHDAIPY